jgi:PhoH-like ATPase
MPLPPPPNKRASRLQQGASRAINPSEHATSAALASTKSKSDAGFAQAPGKGIGTHAAPLAPAKNQGKARSSTKASLPAQAAAPSVPRHDRKPQPVIDPPVYVSQAPAPKELRPRSHGPKRLFVLDTNVLMHDPMCLFQFQEHDIFLPMVVLEELDNHKKGMTEVARNARQTSRSLDALAAAKGAEIEAGLHLDATGHKAAYGRLYFQTQALDVELPGNLPQGKADNQILGVVNALTVTHAPREVVLVTKDINMRIKARALGLSADDYQNDKALDDGDLLYSGAFALPVDFWARAGKSTESWNEGAHAFYRISGPFAAQLTINQFVYYEAPGETSLYAKVVELREKTAVLKSLKDYRHQKNAVWGITAKNREQNFAMNLLMDPEVDFVSLAGTAGTGKTLLALACGLTQVLDDRRYTEIIMTRATVSVGEDIGFLPGSEEEKMGPWMGAMDDNLEVLTKFESNTGEWGRTATNELLRSRIKIKSMNFMRGRTFLSKFVIVDEAQNLTPKQMKTLITRAGPGTKIICMGNLAQIDTPYLTEGSSGLTYAVDKFKGWPHGGHITLARGERSRLADFASEVL